jgi:cellulase (glycosyl hydrolase family 5)
LTRGEPGISKLAIVAAVAVVAIVLASAFVLALPKQTQLTTGTTPSTTNSSSATSSETISTSSVPANPLCALQPCSPMITGWLHTVQGNTSVFDVNGRAVPLAGVDVDGLDFGTGSPASTPDACGKGWSLPITSFANVAAWGFNSVRIPISWENIEPTAPNLAPNGTWVHHWNQQYLNELDSVASQFGETHIAVIFDFAQVDVSGAFQQAPEKVQGGECEGWGNPTWLYPGITSPTTTQDLAAAMCNFFNDRSAVGNSIPQPVEAMMAAEQMLASRYAGNPTLIGIDMFNEPWFGSSCGSTAQDGNLLTSFYTRMGSAIAAANPHLLLIYEDSTPGLMPSSPIISKPPSIANAMYEFHIYTSDWTTGQPYVQAFSANARSAGIPIWMGEFDAFEAGCTGVNCHLDPNWQADTQSLLSFCKTNGINWAYFSYYSLGTSVQTPVSHSQILAVLRSEIPA